jgi:hypothetical protein
MNGAIPPLHLYLYGMPRETFTSRFTGVFGNDTVSFYDFMTSLLDEWIRSIGDDTDRGKAEVLGEETVRMPLYTTNPTRTGVAIHRVGHDTNILRLRTEKREQT